MPKKHDTHMDMYIYIYIYIYICIYMYIHADWLGRLMDTSTIQPYEQAIKNHVQTTQTLTLLEPSVAFCESAGQITTYTNKHMFWKCIVQLVRAFSQ